MRNSGFKLDTKQLLGKLAKAGRIKAALFKPEISNYFLRPSLNKAKAATPVRELSVIRENQIGKPRSQYARWQAQGGDHGVSRSQFLADRAPARFLFQLQWVQVGYSLGVNVSASASVLSATTRNHDEPDIPRGYGQWHGGNVKLSASISVPWLDEPPRKYKPFTGVEIITPIMQSQKPVFERAVGRKLKRTLMAIFYNN